MFLSSHSMFFEPLFYYDDNVRDDLYRILEASNFSSVIFVHLMQTSFVITTASLWVKFEQISPFAKYQLMVMPLTSTIFACVFLCIVTSNTNRTEHWVTEISLSISPLERPVNKRVLESMGT
jgi:hypothetical protein